MSATHTVSSSLAALEDRPPIAERQPFGVALLRGFTARGTSPLLTTEVDAPVLVSTTAAAPLPTTGSGSRDDLASRFTETMGVSWGAPGAAAAGGVSICAT